MSDGYHIGLLIMAALHYLAPQFIQEKRLCWLRSPLWIAKNKNKEEYFYTDEEMNSVRGKISASLQRNKGLGSLTAGQAKNSMFGENQRLDVLEPTPEAIELLEQLMGEKVEPRKDFIFNNVDFSEIKE